MLPGNLQLNHRSAQLCQEIEVSKDELRVAVSKTPSGTTLIDFGIHSAGSEAAALLLARICLADLAQVSIDAKSQFDWPWQQITVSSEQPVAACLASQYAGWEIKGEKYFAMGSGPMRAAAAREPLFEELSYRETASECVGVLESGKLPPDEVCREIAEKCSIEPDRLTLLVAPTHSLCGTLQIVARSVETALHKLHELNFDLTRVKAGRGRAPLPPLLDDDFAAIGRTNDAILYGAVVTLDVTGDDASLQAIGPQVPSSASADYGKPFAEVLAQYGNDFYQVDPLLFSPAEIEFVNLDSGNRFRYGSVNQGILKRSFS